MELRDRLQNSTAINMFFRDTYNKDIKIVKIPINEICCRFSHCFVVRDSGMTKSIKNVGLINPIVITRIEEYKALLVDKINELISQTNKHNSIDNQIQNKKNIQSIKDCINYLQEMEEKGCKYFIVSGHRRFKAYASLALNKNMYYEEGMESLYSQDLKMKIKNHTKNLKAEAIEYLFDDGNSKGNKCKDGNESYKFYKIPCRIISNLTIEKEAEIHSESNLTQRRKRSKK